MNYFNIILFIIIIITFGISLGNLVKNTRKGTLQFTSFFNFIETDFLISQCKKEEDAFVCYRRLGKDFVERWKIVNIFAGVGGGFVLLFIILNFKKLLIN